MKLNTTFISNLNVVNISRQLQCVSAIALVSLALLNPSATVYAQAPDPDTGDAPDSTNHFNQKMETYPGSGIVANYPSVYDDPSGVPGPIHWYPTKDSWLGGKVSSERDADLLPDADGITNIDPSTGEADRDGFDDGVYLDTLVLGDCSQAEFRYNVTIAATPGPTRYANVWFDFNRDGDWDDTVLCQQGSQTIKVREWAVQDQAISSALAPGSYNFGTPKFWSVNPPTPDRPIWMRITLSEQKAPIAPGVGMADGRGIQYGYRTGETEDYLLNGK